MSDNKELDDLLIDSSSPEQSKEDIQKYLEKKQAAYDALEANAEPLDRARLQLDVAEALVGSGRADEAWEKARTALDAFIELEQWQDAVECCDVLYQSAQPASIIALVVKRSPPPPSVPSSTRSGAVRIALLTALN